MSPPHPSITPLGSAPSHHPVCSRLEQGPASLNCHADLRVPHFGPAEPEIWFSTYNQLLAWDPALSPWLNHSLLSTPGVLGSPLLTLLPTAWLNNSHTGVPKTICLPRIPCPAWGDPDTQRQGWSWGDRGDPVGQLTCSHILLGIYFATNIKGRLEMQCLAITTPHFNSTVHVAKCCKEKWIR